MHVAKIKMATISLMKVKSSNALLHMRMVRIRSYLKSVLRYKFVILGTYHPETLREQGYEDPWLFSEDKRCPRAKVSEILMHRHKTGDFLHTHCTPFNSCAERLGFLNANFSRNI